MLYSYYYYKKPSRLYEHDFRLFWKHKSTIKKAVSSVVVTEISCMAIRKLAFFLIVVVVLREVACIKLVT